MAKAAVLEKIELKVGDHKHSVLDARFRCDRCGAQAYVRVTLKKKKKNESGELYWCGHHADKYEAVLKPKCSEWYSERNRLVEDRKTGSEN